MSNTFRQPAYRFDDFEIDVARGDFKSSGKTVHLRPKNFQVLVYLIEHRGRDVSKDQLMTGVWKDTAVVEDVLVQSIKDIRRVLGDDSRNPRYVRTIPKVGYRFIGEVEEIGGPASSTVQLRQNFPRTNDNEPRSELRTHTSRSNISGRFVIVSAISLGIILLALGVFGHNIFQFGGPTEAVSMTKAAGKKNVVVMFFENRSGDADLDWLREGLADMVIADLSRSGSLNVLSRGQLRLLLERMTPGANVVSLDSALDIAGRVEGEAVITGSFARLGDKFRVEAQLYDVKTGEFRAAESLTVDRPEQILKEISLLSLKLASSLDGRNADDLANLGQTITNNLEAYRYYSLGVQKANALQNKEAIELLEKAIALDPEFAMAYARIGYAYAVTWNLPDKGKPYLEKAFRISERLTEKDRLNIAAWYAIANLDYISAIEQYRQIISKYPRETESYLHLAKLLTGEDRIEDAIAALRRGLAVDPDDKDLHNSLGHALSRTGRHSEAISSHMRYVELAPSEPNAFDSLGMSYQWYGDYPSAISNYERALAINPNLDLALVHLGHTYAQMGRYRESLETYQRYIKNAPSDMERARGWWATAEIHLRKRDPNAADRAAKEAFKYRPDAVWHSYLIASERGDATQARDLEMQLLTRLESYSRGAKNSRRHEFYARGYVAMRAGRNDEALANFRDAVEQLPTTWDADVMEDCLANAYLKLGQYDEAIAEYKRILNLNPNYPLARYHLAKAYEGKGMTDRALEAYRQFLEVWSSADGDVPEVVEARRAVGSR